MALSLALGSSPSTHAIGVPKARSAPLRLAESPCNSHSTRFGTPPQWFSYSAERRVACPVTTEVTTADCVRFVGFDTGSRGPSDASEVSFTSKAKPVISQGLLSRQFSHDMRTDSALETRVTFEGDLSASVADWSTRSSVERRALLEAQAQFSVFTSPVVERAFDVAAAAHQHQFRKSGEPVILHCLETAKILADLKADATTIAAALLHDVLDDSEWTAEQLLEHVPLGVVDLVQHVSRISHVSQLNRDRETVSVADAEVERFRSMLLAMADVRAVLIKLADRLHNLRTLDALQPEKQRRMSKETLEVYAPLANRLGMWSLKAELEDLAFQYLQSEQYHALREKVRSGESSTELQTFLDKLKRGVESAGIALHDVVGRKKNLYSVNQKLSKKSASLSDLYDIRAVRVIVNSKHDCYRVLQLLQSQWKTQWREDRFKDYIRNPKPNGYRSLHAIIMGSDGIPIEVQIRTHKMHYLAEYGVAAHWRYKEGSTAHAADEQRVQYLRWLLTWEYELADKKCRPDGSPPRDAALHAVGRMVCAFPHHSPDCKFHDYVSKHHPVQLHDEDTAPTYVILRNQSGSMHIKQVDGSATLKDFLDSEVLAADNMPRQVLVNRAAVHDLSVKLRMGDLIEVVDSEVSHKRAAPCKPPLSSGFTAASLLHTQSTELLQSDMPSSHAAEFESQDDMEREFSVLDLMSNRSMRPLDHTKSAETPCAASLPVPFKAFDPGFVQSEPSTMSFPVVKRAPWQKAVQQSTAAAQPTVLSMPLSFPAMLTQSDDDDCGAATTAIHDSVWCAVQCEGARLPQMFEWDAPLKPSAMNSQQNVSL